MNLRRYDWSDALVEAQTMGVIGNGELNTAMKLAHAINWKPRGGKPVGLYWKNELAADTVGVSRATFYRTIKVLKDTGYLKEDGGNLFPAIPQSHSETHDEWKRRAEALRKSQNETTESQNETSQSQNDNPLSVDTFSEDVCSEKDSADALSIPRDIDHPSLAPTHTDPPSPLLPTRGGACSKSGEGPQSQIETDDATRKVLRAIVERKERRGY